MRTWTSSVGARLGSLGPRSERLRLRASSFFSADGEQEDNDEVSSGAFFYDDQHPHDREDRLKDWRTFRAMMVASEHAGASSPTRRDELRRLFKMNQSARSLGKHVGVGPTGAATASRASPP